MLPNKKQFKYFRVSEGKMECEIDRQASAGILLMATYISNPIYSHEFRVSMWSSDIKRKLGVKLLLLHFERSKGS